MPFQGCAADGFSLCVIQPSHVPLPCCLSPPASVLPEMVAPLSPRHRTLAPPPCCLLPQVISFIAQIQVYHALGIGVGYCATLDVHAAHVPCRFARLISKSAGKEGVQPWGLHRAGRGGAGRG